ncbi:MAG: nitroreductase family protein [Eubacteriaceae bacterium]|jgi:nitroreductase
MNPLFIRHSVRRFKSTEVESEKIEKLVKAAMAAPTAGNQQEWEFIVVTDQKILEELSACSPFAGCAAKAPLAIVPVADLRNAKFPECWQQDLGAAMENILIEAVELGLGGVWLGMAPLEERMEKMTKLFKLPEGVKPFAVAALGYPEKKPIADGRVYNMDKVHYNQF